jgi:hypothetical protein
MNIPPPQPPSQESALAGRRLAGLVVDIGLSCPSCRVQLTLPSAFLGQMVTGPCPVCGLTLVFCHGRIESAPVSAGEMPVGDRGASTVRAKLPRSGTPSVPSLEEVAVPGSGDGPDWGAAARPEASAGSGGVHRVPGLSSLWGWAGLGVAAVLVVAGTVWWLARPGAPPPAPQPPAPGSGGPRVIPDGWAEAATSVWQAFVQAGGVEDKLAHVLDAGRVGPAMRAFYAAHPDADDAWAAQDLQPLAGTPDDRRRGLMALGCPPNTPDGRPLILFFRTDVAAAGQAVEGAASPRFRLDWETYVQEREALVEAFLNDDTAPRRAFRLAVERVHLFDDAGQKPDGPEPLGLKLRTPSGLLLPRVAQVRPGTALYERIDSQLRWGMPVYATLQLAWDATPGPLPRVVVTDLVCWHFPGLGGTPEFEVELSPLPPPPPGS